MGPDLQLNRRYVEVRLPSVLRGSTRSHLRSAFALAFGAVALFVGHASAQVAGRVYPIQHWCSTGWHKPHEEPQPNCDYVQQITNWAQPLTYFPRAHDPWFPKGDCVDLASPSGYKQYIQKPKFCPAGYQVKSFVVGRGCSLPGYSDGFEGTDAMYCQRFNTTVLDPKKNLGSCSAGMPIPSVGNPINTGMYNKFQVETDFSLAGGVLTRQFSRTYNSAKVSEYAAMEAVPQPRLFGPHWASTFDRRLVTFTYGANASTYAVRPDGKVFYFNQVGVQWLPDPDVTDTLVRNVDLSGNHTGWTYVESSTEDVETYDANGSQIGRAHV